MGGGQGERRGGRRWSPSHPAAGLKGPYRPHQTTPAPVRSSASHPPGAREAGMCAIDASCDARACTGTYSLTYFLITISSLLVCWWGRGGQRGAEGGRGARGGRGQGGRGREQGRGSPVRGSRRSNCLSSGTTPSICPERRAGQCGGGRRGTVMPAGEVVEVACLLACLLGCLLACLLVS